MAVLCLEGCSAVVGGVFRNWILDWDRSYYLVVCVGCSGCAGVRGNDAVHDVALRRWTLVIVDFAAKKARGIPRTDPEPLEGVAHGGGGRFV